MLIVIIQANTLACEVFMLVSSWVNLVLDMKFIQQQKLLENQILTTGTKIAR